MKRRIIELIAWIHLYAVGFYRSALMILFSLFPIKDNKIVMISFSGKGYGDNEKYIADELLGRNENVLIVWATKKSFKNSLPNSVLYTKFGSIKYYYHLSTSKIWVSNSRFYYGVRKRKKQFYIQTWHSSLRLKKIEKDIEEKLSPRYVATCRRDSKMIDLITSGNAFSSNIFRRSFWYEGEILECGTPRCDTLINDRLIKKIQEKVRRQYNIDNSKKIILYAPTFRKKKEDEVFYINCGELGERIGEEYIILARMHPNSKKRVDESENVINATNYPDMQELICAADYLVTDYSGCCFDMMIAGKPCILYTPDLDQYITKERDLYFDFKELPFKITDDREDLVKAILSFNEKEYQAKIKQFNKRVGLCEDGHAAEKVTNVILEIING